MSRLSTLIYCFILVLIPFHSASAKEHIKSYHSDIHVLENSDMLVTETITVISEQDKIKRGIYRDLPLKYKDRFGNEIDFKINHCIDTDPPCKQQIGQGQSSGHGQKKTRNQFL